MMTDIVWPFLLKSPNQVVKKDANLCWGTGIAESASFFKLHKAWETHHHPRTDGPWFLVAIKMRPLEVKLKSFVKHLYLFGSRMWLQDGTSNGDGFFSSIKQEPDFSGHVWLHHVMLWQWVELRIDSWDELYDWKLIVPHVFAEIFRLIIDPCSHGRTPIKTMGSDKRISNFNIVQDGCSTWTSFNYSKKNRFPIYNKTLQCCKNARFPKNFPCFQPSSPWRGQLLLGLFLVVGLNDEIEILSAVSYIFFHWILSSRPGWRYHPGMRWEWMGLGDRAQSLSSVKWWVSENDGMIWERKVL